MGGDVAKYEMCLRMITFISKENVLPNDPLAITLKRAFENQDNLVQQTDLDQLIATHGSGLEKGLQRLAPARLPTESYSTIDQLRKLYHAVLDERQHNIYLKFSQFDERSPGLTPPFSQHPTTGKSGVPGVASTGWPGFPAPTKEPLSTQPGTLSPLRLVRNIPVKRSLTCILLCMAAPTPIQDTTTPRPASWPPPSPQAQPAPSQQRIGSISNPNAVLLFSLLIGVAAGLGAGLWQLGVSKLSIGEKLGVGFAVLFSILAAIAVFLLYRRRRIMSRRPEPVDDMDTNSRVISWLRGGGPTGTTKPKASVYGTNTTVTNDAENLQPLTAS